VLFRHVAQPIFTMSVRNCRAIPKSRAMDVHGCVCLDNDFSRVTRSFPPRGKAETHDSLSLRAPVGIDQKYISPRYDSAECFLFRGRAQEGAT